MTNYEHDLHHFIVENFLFGKEDTPLTRDESLLERGVIDSTGVLELVGYLEKTYGIVIEDEELIPENLDSIERLVRFLERKRQPEMAGRREP
jgi:acyl carrier protein